ncbi:hypothetical protein C474_12636 [Halogeometricum pallidum JCM 14848]|uniref:Uncharacterized protein n=1 Tax=Halogeometricum pallidum JCM 14848 TaxID=1227487 RepID=M0D5B8_HALPD|nr:hypothetical protein [Halogeometricum pallidum]ELZ29882.1 hypothetical protein C474_12636 [Halogeometricum pallidum JCM 14848]
MSTWLDPRDDAAWGGVADEPARPDPVAPTLERAHAVTLPYRFSETRTYYETLADLEIDGRAYTSAEVTVVGGVTRDRTLKLHVRGYLWQEAGPAPNAYRFQSQVTREASPTETVPFDTYHTWHRSQRGTVTHDGVVADFVPDEGTEATERDHRAFGDLFEPLRMALAELELVRNPQFASYVLRETDRWEAYGAVFRWHANAFSRREAL